MNKFKKKYLPVAMLASVAVTAVLSTTAIAGSAKGKPFVELQGQIIEVEGSISTMQEQIDLLIGDVDSIDARMVAAEASIIDLGEQNAALQTMIHLALTTIDDIEAEIISLSSDVEGNAGLITDLQAAVAGIQQGQIELEEDLLLQINQNETLIATLQAELDAQADWEAFNANLINGTCPNGTAVTSIQADGSLVCGDTASGGASGTLSSFTVFGNQVRTYPVGTQDPYSNGSISGYNFGYATCPEGSIVTSGQWVSGGSRSVLLSFTQTYAHGSSDGWSPKNSARIGAFNNSATYSLSFRPAATCMRLN